MRTMKTLTDAQLDRLGVELGVALNARWQGPKAGDFTTDCENDHARTQRILGDMGLTWGQIEAVTEELNDRGGHCDCEVMLNVVSTDDGDDEEGGEA